MTELEILDCLAYQFPTYSYIWGFGWYRQEDSGHMVQIPIGELEQFLIHHFYDNKTLKLRDITSALHLFEWLQGKVNENVIGTFCFANERKEQYFTQINLPLNPQADVGRCLRWAESVYPQEPLLLMQIGGYILFHPNNSFQKIFLVSGPGGNGKGTFLRIIKTILQDYVTGPPLAYSVDFDEFGKHDRFEIIGKQLVYDPDISGSAKVQRWLKILSGGDTITAEKKFKQPINFTPTCKLLLLSNPIPDWKNDPAMTRRIILLRFTKKFKVNAKFEESLLTPEMLEKWIAFFWHGYQDFKKHGFRLIDENLASEFLAESDDFASFVQDWCVLSEKYEIPCMVLYHQFLGYWKTVLQETRSPLNARVVGKRLKELGIDRHRNQTLTPEQCAKYHLPSIEGKRYDMFKGITLEEFC